MKCIHCEAEIESDDNFCPKCGHWTPHGYDFLKDQTNIEMIAHGESIKQSNRLVLLMSLFVIGCLTFTIMMFIRGESLFLPFSYLKKQWNNYMYGYNTSAIKTDNKYDKIEINTYEDAISFIKKDFQKQTFICREDNELFKIEDELEKNYQIPNVVFCDMPYEEASKIKKVIDRMYFLFPNIEGALTNITITNASHEYIARFQPMYQFVNIEEDITKYNKVNKTQILLNSYYFLNEEMLDNSIQSTVGENWYVEDATWESSIAHEIGHYISFVLLLKENKLANITLVNSSNYQSITNVLNSFEKGNYQQDILNTALNNYNTRYNTKLDLTEFALTISRYASEKDDNGNLIYDEIIAEAIHDYYLHDDNMQSSSAEIIKIIKEMLK